MDTNTIALVVIIVIVAGFFLWAIFKGKYIGSWIIHTAQKERLYVTRTANDARNDGKETMQFHLTRRVAEDETSIDGNNSIVIVPTHWIILMEKMD